jgi:predicted RNA binding protein YcfA (HicA-like mRNA interferase family)
MSKLGPVSHNELVKRLRIFGFDGPFSGGKHLYMVKGNLRLTIPNPNESELKRV